MIKITTKIKLKSWSIGLSKLSCLRRLKLVGMDHTHGHGPPMCTLIIDAERRNLRLARDIEVRLGTNVTESILDFHSRTILRKYFTNCIYEGYPR